MLMKTHKDKYYDTKHIVILFIEDNLKFGEKVYSVVARMTTGDYVTIVETNTETSAIAHLDIIAERIMACYETIQAYTKESV